MPIHCDASRIHIRFERRWVHGHSGGVYLVSSRTQKSSPPASLPILWYESPRERKSLCPSSFTRNPPKNQAGTVLVPAFFCFSKVLYLWYHLLAELIEMPIDTVDIFGSDQIGIHLATVGDVIFHPPELTKPVKDVIDKVIGLESCELTIGGSNLIGALLAGNSKGMAVADIATEKDIDTLTAFGDVVVMEGGVNTAGNLLLVNENGAVASPSIPAEGLEIISEVMAVNVAATTIAGQDVVGSLGVCNDQGILLHPDVTPEEVLLIEEVLKIPPMVGTACFGSPYVGAGICASNNGALAGSETTGPEMNRIEDALGLL